MRILISSVLAGLLAGQAAGQPDWSRVETETLSHFQALIRFDTSDPPGGEKPAVDYLKSVLEREGIPVEVFALEAHRPNLVARLKGTGKKRPLLIMAPHRRRQRRPQEVDAPAVRRGPRRRLHLRARHRRRQGQPGGVADDDGDAEADERAARSRRDLPRGGGRGRVDPGRHQVHDRAASVGHRRRVLSGGRGRRQPVRRHGQVRVGADPREDAARDRAGGARGGRPRVGPAPDQSDRRTWRRRWPGSPPGSRRFG